MAKRTNQVAWWLALVLAVVVSGGAAPLLFRVGRDYLRQQALVDAAKRGDVRAAQALLNQGVSVKARDRKLSAFEYALQLGTTDVVNAFLAHGANVNARGASGATPLELAVRSGNAAVVSVLLAHGADPNTRDPILGGTPLMIACADLEPRIEIVRDLIKHGANVNVKNEFGNTALMIAGGHKPAVVQLLLAHGAQVDALNREGQSALTIVQEGLEIAKRKGWSDYASSDAATLRLLKQAQAKQRTPANVQASTRNGTGR